MEQNIEAAAVTTAAISEQHTRSAIEGFHNEVKAHIDQPRGDVDKLQEEMWQSVSQMAAGLENLTKQLNSFKHASAEIVGNLQENLSKEITQKIAVSEKRIGELSQSVENQKKSVEDTNELLKDLIIGNENLGDNMKNIQKEMD